MGEPEELVDALDELLESMSPRTRRPIRFLEPEETQPQALETDSALLGADSVLPATQPITTQPMAAGGSVVPLTRKPSSQ
jgi:hypothetical protein